MKRIGKIAACTMVVLFLFLSLSIQPRLVFGENTSQPKIMPTPSELGKSGSQFQAVISKDTILVGESAVITFKGRQLDVAGGNTIDNIGSEFASIVKLMQVDKAKFKVTGIAPGEAAITFKNGDKESVVKVTVVVGGLN